MGGDSMKTINCISDKHVIPKLPTPALIHDMSHSPYGKWHITNVINRQLKQGGYLFYKDIFENKKWHLHIPNRKIETSLYWDGWERVSYTTGDIVVYSQTPCIMINVFEDTSLICVTYEWYDIPYLSQ